MNTAQVELAVPASVSPVVTPRRWFARALIGIGPPLVGLLIIVAFWEVTLRLVDVPEYLLPAPSDIADAAVENRWDLLMATWQTARAAVIGLGLAIIFGVGGAICLAFSETLERAFVPFAILFQAIPSITIAPLLVIWLGPGLPSIVVVSMIISFFPMLSNALVGLHSVDPETKNLFQLYGSSRWQLMRKLRVPGSMPYVLAGVRIAGGLAIKGAVIGEFVAGVGGGRGGLGYIVQFSSRNLQTSYLFAGAICGAALGIAFYVVVKQVTQILLGWHESASAGRGATVQLQPVLAGGG
jgi:NitT/TauT family transport system permease protein